VEVARIEELQRQEGPASATKRAAAPAGAMEDLYCHILVLRFYSLIYFFYTHRFPFRVALQPVNANQSILGV